MDDREHFGLSKVRAQPRWVRAAEFLGVTLLYVLGFLLFHETLGVSVTPLALLPVAVAGWFFGLRIGLLTGLVFVLLNLVLLVTIERDMRQVLFEGGWAGLAALVLAGSVVGWLSDVREQLGHELAERRRVERKLKAYSEHLEDMVEERTAEIQTQYARQNVILDSVGDAILLSGLDRKVQYVNHAFSALTGYTAEEMIGRTPDFLSVEDPPEHVLEARQAAMQRGEIWRDEIAIRCKDGRVYDAGLSIAPVHDAQGRLTGHVATHRDISARKSLERARTQFITNISHQLRTPVSTIQLYAHLLKDEELSDKVARYAQNIRSEAIRLTSLLEDILVMAMLESGRVVDTWKPVRLAAVIDSIVTLYQEQARRSGLAFEATMHVPEDTIVNGDQARLAQALGELVENAVTFTPSGGHVAIEVERVEDQASSWIVMRVVDDGPGIPDDEQTQVFDRFFRGRVVEAGHIPGTGLGLSIAQAIVRAHSGRLTLESEVDQGSTFTIWLPVVEQDEIHNA